MPEGVPKELEKAPSVRIVKQKAAKKKKEILFQRGDSVMVYPEDYDFSIVFETAENRKVRHNMERKYVFNWSGKRE